MTSANPPKDGRYLVCIYEWVGLASAKPEKPEWHIRRFGTKDGWERANYQWDTGGYENFDVWAWQELPAIPKAVFL